MFTGSQRVSSYRSNPSKRSMAAFSTKRSSITPSVSRTSLKPSMPVPSRRFRGGPSSIFSFFVSIPCRSEGSSEDGRCGGAARPTGAEPYTCIRDTFHIEIVRIEKTGFPFIRDLSYCAIRFGSSKSASKKLSELGTRLLQLIVRHVL